MGDFGSGRRPGGFVAGLARNLRYAVRGLVRRPGFAMSIIVTLALGIGANTAVFSAIDGILLEPLPYPQAERLVFVWGQTEDDDTELLSVLRRWAPASVGSAGFPRQLRRPASVGVGATPRHARAHPASATDLHVVEQPR